MSDLHCSTKRSLTGFPYSPFEAYQLFKEDDSATETETNMLKLFTSMAMSPELDE